jgi:hypothetical protein
MWGAWFVKRISDASSYSPERAEMDFRIARPKLARALSDRFPDRYALVFEQVSTVVSLPDGDIEAGPQMVDAEIAARFGSYAAFAGDDRLRVALDAIATEFRLSADEITGQCSDVVAPLYILHRRRLAVDAAIAEGVEAPLYRDPVSGEGYTFLVLALSQRGIGEGVLQAYLAGEPLQHCVDVATILETLNSLDTRDARAMRADLVARYAVML